MNAIDSQTLTVIYQQSEKTGEEIFRYTPGSLGGINLPPELKQIDRQVLRKQVEDVRRQVELLTERAKFGQPRADALLEERAWALAHHVLPSKGLRGILLPGFHPQFDVFEDEAYTIPWEVLEEHYFACAKNHRTAVEAAYCGECSLPLAPRSERLAISCHLTHVVRGSGRLSAEGDQFLFIEDPCEDLCSPENDPAGLCQSHLDTLHQLVEKRGFMLNIMPGSTATRENVLNAIANPAVAGIYYFGHGYFPRGRHEGCLLLSDGPLSATHIQKRQPSARLVFLNACSGADSGRDWDFESRPRNVAAAFAEGRSDKVVIAPLWPVLNTQAAEMAVTFFTHATDSERLGEATLKAREASHRRYEAGEAHLTWMAYRYFGDPNRMLPSPSITTLAISSETQAVPSSRLFANEGPLDTELFSFDADSVLLRAAKRRNQQSRSLITVTDLLAGLLRKGDLTRELFGQLKISPDDLYQAVLAHVEPGGTAPSGADPAAELAAIDAEKIDAEAVRRFLAKWVVRVKEQFAPTCVGLLEHADQAAQARGAATADCRISEIDLLKCLLADPAWGALALLGLPSAAQSLTALQQIERAHEVDQNGEISLHGLDSDAQRVIQSSHILAQQRRVFPIPHRLTLAAFLPDANGHAAKVCRQCGVDPKLFGAFLIASTEKDGGEDSANEGALSFGLSREACTRVVLPMIQAARLKAGRGRLVTTRDLFQGFCERAAPYFKEFVRTPFEKADLESAEADLDELKASEPSPDDDLLNRLTLRARKVVRAAHALAEQQGFFPIPNRLLLAAFLSSPKGWPAQLLLRHQIPPQALADGLIASGGRAARRSLPLAAACERIVKPVILRARELAGPEGFITERILFRAFCLAADPALKQTLKPRIDLDQLGIESEASPPSEAAAPIVSPTEATSPPAPSPAASDQSPVTATEPLVLPSGWTTAQFDEAAGHVLETAAQMARQDGWPEIRTPHLFAALIGDGSGPAGTMLRQHRMSPPDILKAARSLVPPQPGGSVSLGLPFGDNARKTLTHAHDIAQGKGRDQATEEDILAAFLADKNGIVSQLLQAASLQGAITASAPLLASSFRPQSTSVLGSLGVDLTEKARRGQLPKIVGRDHDIDTAMQTLLLTENANPLLVGEAGVGKTAIVEGLAARVAEGRCPRQLRSVRIIELSAGMLVANTGLRGEFEQRVQQLLAEAHGDFILFIDEIHTIVGAGGGAGSLDVGNMLKTALARGELKLIGSTTHTEFKRTIARDKALARRFQIQPIGPPSREATIEILTARQPFLESHHGVNVTKEAKLAAVDLSGRYIVEKQWPAKARDVLERACVLAITSADTGDQSSVVPVTLEHVAKVVSRQTGIPVERVSACDRSALETLAERISARVIGQPEAIETVTNAIRRGRQDLADRSKPWGVFLFIGPPGVGKTELAKVLAEEVYGGADGLIRFDMGDFTEPHSTAKLVGAPPGYVGYEQGSPLMERLRTHPYSLVLFDEIEHAHENVLAVLLRLLSEGTLVDGDGNIADARNSIVIMTSNLLAPGESERTVGFGTATTTAAPSQGELRSSMERQFPAKLIDRLDGIIRFNKLRAGDLEAIARNKLTEVVSRISLIYGVEVDIAEEVFPWLARKAASESNGARGMQRVVDSDMAAPLAAFLSASPAQRGVRIRVAVEGEKIQVAAKPPSPEASSG
ncbi:MAG: AAA family ATPase [Verrucomicrobia subdivision 3 bacterium]|nr:AAA family ATPase [Limisphaerales bacterium]